MEGTILCKMTVGFLAFRQQSVGLLLTVLGALSLMPSCGSGDKRNEISLAAVGPLTGPAATRGKDMERAARMAVDEINAAGGVNGKQIRLTVYDDGDDPGARPANRGADSHHHARCSAAGPSGEFGRCRRRSL